MYLGSDKYGEIKYVDDVSRLLTELCGERDIAVIKEKLVDIVLFIRYELKTRGSLKGIKTESLGELETHVIKFLASYNGHDFEELYHLIYELIKQIPKFNIYGIDITELRDIAHDFEAEYRYDPVFGSIAADIRKLTHQHLSDKVISKIEKFEQFLLSDKTSAMIDGSTVYNVSKEAKEDLLESEIFQELLELKNKLKIAWSDRGDTKNGMSREEFFKVIDSNLSGLITDEVKTLKNYEHFLHHLQRAKEVLKDKEWEDAAIGRIRYNLKKLIEEITLTETKNKGELLFRLITTDSLLEQIAFIYYSNLVNTKYKIITDNTYIDALHLLVDLTFCVRAVGHGTKILGRFALLIERILLQLDSRPDRIAHFPSIVEAMNSELENNFLAIKELYYSYLSDRDNAPALTAILNNIIREKTTHVLGILINSIKNYDVRKSAEPYQQILDELKNRGKLTIKDFVYSFGTDIDESIGKLEKIEFMGGKGFSQIRNSRILRSIKLPNFDVPKGYGFSTLTWYHMQKGFFTVDDIRNEIFRMIKNLEKRTGKKYGDSDNPLLLMARSGSVVSMPGILDTVSHIGINKEIADRWSKNLKEPARAYQAYISFMLSYAKSVLGLDTEALVKETGFDSYVSVFREGLFIMKDAADAIFQAIQEKGCGAFIPDDPYEQIYKSAIAVFRSFESDVVKKQTIHLGIPEQFQTGCLIQECVPVLSANDCSGVFFTRNPNTGRIGSKYDEQIEFSDGFFGNVIADGAITPGNTEDFIRLHPEHYEGFRKFKYVDERIQRFPTDIEFAIRGGVAYIVQSRVLKQSPIARIINSYEFYKENIYTKYKLIKRTAFGLNKKIIGTYLDRKALSDAPVIAQGKPVNGGAVRGRLIKDQNSISLFDGKLIFITESNVPPKVIMAENRFYGYISKEGGVTSHAALVAIGEGKPCVTDVHWEQNKEPGHEDEIIIGSTVLREGDYITLDANTGMIYKEDIPILEVSVVDSEYKEIKDAILSVIEELVAPVEQY
ncbi:MAG TPA: PEP-utilizing enzyme [Spirochaetota bacterium]|jgi:phosphohistidine swiveling domain-containing protein|nr:MAG: Pyruvate, phosphate dikinase [Spirochaetes bacterium ADurb.Bin218]HOK01412.1 PEP-utilizing enzyme [Spirochaetota bacterium]HOK92102.1 PEP-utilizing enzyme [Spirochaetota bacterium]HON15612.1 PEP-utilizing enzyme [Spirochaetota bacterium]HOQ10999.1 PEP-utilizing enzyme [Spirochaetota bacterium]